MALSPCKIKARIIEAAKRNHCSVKHLCRNAGLKDNYVNSSLDKGSLPGADALNAIADAGGVSVDWLIGRTDNPAPAPSNISTAAESPAPYHASVRIELDIPPDAKPGDKITGKIVKQE